MLKSSRIRLHWIRMLKAHYHEPNRLQTEKIMNQTISSHSETSTKIKSWENPEFPSHERKHFFDHSWVPDNYPLNANAFISLCMPISSLVPAHACRYLNPLATTGEERTKVAGLLQPYELPIPVTDREAIADLATFLGINLKLLAWEFVWGLWRKSAAGAGERLPSGICWVISKFQS